jgi:hypothetical protein
MIWFGLGVYGHGTYLNCSVFRATPHSLRPMWGSGPRREGYFQHDMSSQQRPAGVARKNKQTIRRLTPFGRPQSSGFCLHGFPGSGGIPSGNAPGTPQRGTSHGEEFGDPLENSFGKPKCGRRAAVTFGFVQRFVWGGSPSFAPGLVPC